MVFIEFEKGNINNLEGRVLAYAKTNDPQIPSEKLMLGFYGFANPVDFKEKFGEDVLEEYLNEVDKVIGKKSNIPNDFQIPFYTTAVPVSKGDIKLASEDVMNLGEFNDETNLAIALTSSIGIYMANYLKQKMSKAGMQKQGKQKPGEEDTKEKISYLNISEDQRTFYIQKNHISPIMHSLETGENNLAIMKAQEFVRFCRKSPLVDDAYAIVSVLNNPLKNQNNKQNYSRLLKKDMPNQELMRLYFEKILAIVNERYSDAAIIRDKIKDIDNK